MIDSLHFISCYCQGNASEYFPLLKQLVQTSIQEGILAVRQVQM